MGGSTNCFTLRACSGIFNHYEHLYVLNNHCSCNALLKENSEINLADAQPLKHLTSGLGDSGCSDHFLSANVNVENVILAGKDAATVVLPNRVPISSSHISTLKYNKLPL